MRFELTIEGHSLAVFSELVSISSAIEIADAISSSSTETILKKLPGKRNPPTVTLKRGMTRNIEMAAWHELVILGDIAAARKSCSLTMFNAKGDPVARYHLTDAWPQRIEIGVSGTSGVLTETVTMTCDFIQRVSV
ncbi:MAG TPA: phage tail protein [Acidimicrobiales bacterium]|nr:phage tail protein [Acidimicrobiales bacterium]